MNKQDLISKIKKLAGISPDEQAYLINLVNTKKKYGLVWEDKPEDVEEQLRTNLPVLREVVEKRISPSPLTPKGGTATDAGDEAPNHILIEGDNLHALTALTFTHEGKIDVIYIDPPYNTGKENEFRYNDKWILKENTFKHSMWLNFISKRLKIAKRLLTDDGVFICHIDENEFDTLNLLLETEIFSENDFLGVIIWNKLNPKGEVVGVATMHEYVLIYAKNKENFKSLENILSRAKPNALTILNKAKNLFLKIGKKQIPETIKEVIKPFNYSKELIKDFEVVYDLQLVNTEFQAWLSKQDFSGGEKAYKFIDEKGDVYRGVSMAAPDKPETRSHRPLIHPISNKVCPVPSKGWRNPDNTMDKLLNKGMILFGDDENKQPERKYLLKENLSEVTPSIYNNGSSDEVLMKDLNINFPYPKVTSASQYFLKNIHPNPKIILDFFAGSGTTLHATMVLNEEDGGNRQCILVTNNEIDTKTETELIEKGIEKESLEFEAYGICQAVTYERNKRVIEGYINAKGVAVEGLKNNNLRYYKADYVGRAKTHKNKKEMTRLATELLCIKEDCYNLSPALSLRGTKQSQIAVFDDTKTQMVVVYDDAFIEESIAIIKQLQDNKQNNSRIKVYVFSNGNYPYTDDYNEVAAFVELCALPDAIYKAYQNVLPKTKREVVPTLDEEGTENDLFNQ